MNSSVSQPAPRHGTSMHLPIHPRTATVAERQQAGLEARKRRPRSGFGSWVPGPDRPDPVELLASQETTRIQALLPLRHSRMSASAFAFYRGAAAIMANDLGALPNSGLVSQLCGDAHLSNFGVFAAPDRSLVFDVNDFDETNPGPFEWDVMRLAVSFVLAGRDRGMDHSVVGAAAVSVAEAYRTQMATYAGMSDLATWYDRVDAAKVLQWSQEVGIDPTKNLSKVQAKAQSRSAWSAIDKMTQEVDGQRRFRDLPPLLMPAPDDPQLRKVVDGILRDYRSTLSHDRQHLLLEYHVVDMAHKVVGVGSVGLLAFVILMQGRDENDLIVLQAKQAVTSVLEPFTARSRFTNSGERVVAGQQFMQAASDIFLGWVHAPGNRDYYVRQLRDMKYSPDPAKFTPERLSGFATLCGRTLARAHARGGDAVAISAYLGTSDKFDRAMRDFSLAYADQAERDYAAYQQAIADGRVSISNKAEESSYVLTVDPSTGVDVSVRPPASADPGPESS